MKKPVRILTLNMDLVAEIDNYYKNTAYVAGQGEGVERRDDERSQMTSVIFYGKRLLKYFSLLLNNRKVGFCRIIN